MLLIIRWQNLLDTPLPSRLSCYFLLSMPGAFACEHKVGTVYLLYEIVFRDRIGNTLLSLMPGMSIKIATRKIKINK